MERTVLGRAGYDYNRGQQQNRGGSAENYPTQLLDPRVLLKQAGENFANDGETQGDIDGQARPIDIPVLNSGNRNAVIQNEKGSFLHRLE